MHPMTQEQEQEMREWARKIKDSHINPKTVVFSLGCHVFRDGRLSDTVSVEDRIRIAREEIATS